MTIDLFWWHWFILIAHLYFITYFIHPDSVCILTVYASWQYMHPDSICILTVYASWQYNLELIQVYFVHNWIPFILFTFLRLQLFPHCNIAQFCSQREPATCCPLIESSFPGDTVWVITLTVRCGCNHVREISVCVCCCRVPA